MTTTDPALCECGHCADDHYDEHTACWYAHDCPAFIPRDSGTPDAGVLDLDALRQVAEAATPGPWEHGTGDWCHMSGWQIGRPDAGSMDGFRPIAFTGTENYDDDAAHIATFDPPTVLALIDALEAAEAQDDHYLRFDGLRQEIEALRNQVARVADQINTIRQMDDGAQIEFASGIEVPLADLIAGLTLALDRQEDA